MSRVGILEHGITEDDLELVERARKAIKERYEEDWHSIGAALRTSDGDIYTSVNVEATVGRISVCAEAIAVSNSLYDGKKSFDTIVAVKYPRKTLQDQTIQVVSPCGMCRELVSDYDPDTKVILLDGGKLKKMGVLDLLPYKYKRR